MKKLLKIVGILAIIGALVAAYLWFFVYNKPHRDYENAKPDFVMSATACYQHFAQGKQDEINYTGKILELSGIASHIEDRDSLVVLAFVFNKGMFGDEGIRCTMLPNHNEKALALDINEMVRVKGFCSGYNGTDVILEQCSIINK
ncbi:MAG: hypothetical protein P8100_05785 [bacterium]|jgi:hypothetical protein